jgi:hypothetical protein
MGRWADVSVQTRLNVNANRVVADFLLLRLTAQITSTQTSMPWGDGPFLQDLDLVVGFGRSQYASFTWADLDCIAPWMKDLITKRIDGPGLGI